ncbi:MAG: aminotransferase class IV [Cyanobacteriota bacterium]|nr:aminotransferase class IV [Cyanobacteriota bacterium]
MTQGPAPIAWIAGQWGHPDHLSLPLSDRGLLLADGLFETVLVQQGQPRLLAEHLERWRSSAVLLAMAAPPAAAELGPLLAEAVARSGIGEGALRLNWSRGSPAGDSRGIDLPDASQHRFWLSLNPWRPRFTPLRARISPIERRSAGLLSRCKTFAYGGAIQARREARVAGADEALLLGEGGQLCCGSTANLLVRRRGRWLTPPLASGCLPGVMRGRALALGLAEEAEIRPEQVLGWGEAGGEDADGACLLLNSLGCRPLSQINGRPQPLAAGEAPWLAILHDGAAKDRQMLT